jgi:Protein of unknown function (DUF1769)
MTRDSTSWRHRPVFLRPGDDTLVSSGESTDFDTAEGLPLGIPFEFESPIFKGTMLVRLRNVNTDDRTGSHDAYFKGNKRVMQTVVQGQFKKPIKMSDVYVGSVFSQPLAFPPPPSMQRILTAVFKRIAPSVILDLTSSRPKVLALYAGSAQSMSVDVPGAQPDVTAVDIPENMSRLLHQSPRGWTRNTQFDRQKQLSLPNVASQYTYDTNHVYTFHTYDDTMDYGTYTVNLPMFGKFNIGKALGKQPMTMSAVLPDGTPMYSFQVLHETMLSDTV